MSESGIYVDFETKEGSRALDISASATREFGFLYHDRVMTPLGPATVLGAIHGRLWFLVDGDAAASYWSHCRSAQDYIDRGFTKIEDTAPKQLVRAPDSKKFHDIRTVSIQGVARTVIMQSLNGPCPIIALANTLLLRGELASITRLAASTNYITAEDLRRAIKDYLVIRRPAPPFCASSCSPDATLAGLCLEGTPHLDALREKLESPLGETILGRFYDGLDVSPIFDVVDGFAREPNALIFALAGVRVVHGWIVPPDAPFADQLRTRSYDELMVFPFDDAIDVSVKEAACGFLQATASQLTHTGISALNQTLAVGEVCVLLHNNHFSTLVRTREQRLLTLVTDVAFLGRDQVVFEELTVDGASSFYDGDETVISAKAMSVLDSFGRRYTVAEIDLAIVLLDSTGNSNPSSAEIVTMIDAQRSDGAEAVGGGASHPDIAPPPPRL